MMAAAVAAGGAPEVIAQLENAAKVLRDMPFESSVSDSGLLICSETKQAISVECCVRERGGGKEGSLLLSEFTRQHADMLSATQKPTLSPPTYTQHTPPHPPHLKSTLQSFACWDSCPQCTAPNAGASAANVATPVCLKLSVWTDCSPFPTALSKGWFNSKLFTSASVAMPFVTFPLIH
ncbi:hypothetical protein UY3_06412 [Chelonia mydas]|uniref:Uncharacterized protein n=1 Tax=Chelonia mydas TaxID=8469 RepID=M7BL30_CHEMY|nr:hypothetical protein UY3_06412 [Chelonia mydas]